MPKQEMKKSSKRISILWILGAIALIGGIHTWVALHQFLRSSELSSLWRIALLIPWGIYLSTILIILMIHFFRKRKKLLGFIMLILLALLLNLPKILGIEEILWFIK